MTHQGTTRHGMNLNDLLRNPITLDDLDAILGYFDFQHLTYDDDGQAVRVALRKLGALRTAIDEAAQRP